MHGLFGRIADTCAARVIWLTSFAALALIAAPALRADEQNAESKKSPSLHLDDKDTITVMLGAGYEHIPTWIGSRTYRYRAVPYVDIEWPDHFALSTVDGLRVDLIHDTPWHGGFYANYLWGRDRSELSKRLRRVIRPISPRLQAGGYVEYQATSKLSFGSTLSHDTQDSGAYLDIYADYELPAIGYLQHSLEWQWQAMNGQAMRRFFGLTPSQARRLDVKSWEPSTGSQQMSLEYDAFMPTSLHTGIVLGLNYSELLGAASESPIVRHYGSSHQFTTSLAFVYRL
ncbi:MipA/OmpV family protein [Dyella silvatica]|uniref:MipA/OmpV family protein n=1 Tax=Dyella silvatica TaxID=2992128 RepID=UPI002253B865|nr:MipA/OmpV family protein [Dyella silvatica]